MLADNGHAAAVAESPGLPMSYPALPVIAEDTRRVFVDRGLTLRGEFSGCDHLAIAGHVESDVVLRILDVLEHGSFKGGASAGSAYIAGRYEGTLTVEETLVVGPAAHISGSVQCGKLRLEEGGKIEGDLRILAEEATEAQKPEDDPAPEAPLRDAAPGMAEDATEKHGVLPSLDEAEATFKTVLDRHPDNLGALAGLGHLARRRGDHAEMHKYYAAALALEPMNVTLRVEVARAFKEQGEVALARQILETLLTEQGGSPPDASLAG
jgi:cytoskeletal protein CcmA (bactofilin family)